MGRDAATRSSSDRDRGDDEGRIGLLLAVCVALVLFFVLVSANATMVAVEKRRLLACADRVSSWVAGAVDGDGFYASGDTIAVEVSAERGRARAQGALSLMAASTCDIGQGVRLSGVAVSGQNVSVTVGARADLPLVPPILEGVVAPDLTATSSARLWGAN